MDKWNFGRDGESSTGLGLRLIWQQIYSFQIGKEWLEITSDKEDKDSIEQEIALDNRR